MDVPLTPELEQLVKKEIASGHYASSTDVVREALQLLEERDQKLEALRKDIAGGIEQADRGELTPVSEVFKQLRKRNPKASGVRD